MYVVPIFSQCALERSPPCCGRTLDIVKSRLN